VKIAREESNLLTALNFQDRQAIGQTTLHHSDKMAHLKNIVTDG